MNEIENAVIRILREAISEENPDPSWLTDSIWPDIYKELIAQTVAFIPADIVLRSGISKEQKLDYKKALLANTRKYIVTMQEQSEVIGLLEYNNISVVVLKGAAAAMYYPHPEYRQMGDIDILVEPDCFERASQLLLENGYSFCHKDNIYKRHTGFNGKYGVEIELHRYFSSSSNKKQNSFLDAQLYSGIRNKKSNNGGGFEVPTLPNLENGLVLLGHINQHLGSGLGLRQIVDWLLYVKKYLSDEVWSSNFKALADEIGMTTLAETSTKLCASYLGLKNISWCNSSDPDLVDGLLSYILHKGNFGRKFEYGSNTTISVMHHFSNPISAFRYLTSGGICHWEAARNHLVLRPFAWIYQIGHLIRMGLKRKVNVKTIVGEAVQSQSEVVFLDRLGVTRK